MRKRRIGGLGERRDVKLAVYVYISLLLHCYSIARCSISVQYSMA